MSSGGWVRADWVCVETLIPSLLLRDVTAIGSLQDKGTRCGRKLKKKKKGKDSICLRPKNLPFNMSPPLLSLLWALPKFPVPRPSTLLLREERESPCCPRMRVGSLHRVRWEWGLAAAGDGLESRPKCHSGPMIIFASCHLSVPIRTH